MRTWKWLGLGIYLLATKPASAQPSAAFPPDSEPAQPESESAPEAPPASAASVDAPGPVVPQQQAAPPDHAGGSQPALFPPPSDVREVERWYGGYTLMTDGLSLGAVIAGGIAENNGRSSGETFFWIAGGGYLLGAPIVHLAHENPGRAALSLGMRIAIPIAFFGTGVLIEGCPGGDFCGLPSLVIGVPLGMATAIALDASLVARDTVEESFTIAPTAMLGRHGASIGVAGTF